MSSYYSLTILSFFVFIIFVNYVTFLSLYSMASFFQTMRIKTFCSFTTIPLTFIQQIQCYNVNNSIYFVSISFR